MKEIQYRPLQHGAIDPNKARWYSLGLSAVGVLFAFLTVKTNWDYFAQFYDGFAFWCRVVPFFGVEAMIIALPAFKGFGSKGQGNMALWCELLLVAGALTHTYLVSDYSIAKLQAGKTKTEASADFDRAQAVSDRVTASNQKLMDSHNRQMRLWRDAVFVAQREGKPAPPAPQAPKLQDVPQVNQNLVNNATMSVEMAGEQRVSHQTLQRLLFLLVGLVTVSITSMVLLADGSRIRAWLLGMRAEEIKTQTKGETRTLGRISMAPPAQPVQAQAPPDFEARNSKPGLFRRLSSR